MNQTIWRLELVIKPGRQTFPLSRDFTPLHVGVKDGQAWLWVLVDPDAPRNEELVVEMFGTGWEIAEEEGFIRIYLGTTVIGGFVWHWFRRLPLLVDADEDRTG
jgi:hypothetical protein